MGLYSPHTQALLKAHRHQGQSNDCGPYTVGMVVQALRGSAPDPGEIARRMNRPRWRGAFLVVRRIPNWATFPWGVADALQEYNLPARWQPFASREQLRRGLQSGEILMPVIGAWLPRPWAHIAVLVAWDPARGGWGFVDPLVETPRIHWRDEETFARQWNALLRLLVRVPAPQRDAEPLMPAAGEPVA